VIRRTLPGRYPPPILSSNPGIPDDIRFIVLTQSISV
jgi:hypothetical protein